MALGAKSLLMPEVGNMGFRLQDNIFLQMLFNLLNPVQVIAITMRALIRCRYIDGFIDVGRRGPWPARMALGSPSFFLLFVTIQRNLQ